MKSFLNAFLGVLACSWIGASVLRADTWVSEASSHSYPLSPNGTIELAETNGTVTIEAWDQSGVRVDAEKRAHTAEDLALIEIRAESQADHLAIATKYGEKPGLFERQVEGEVRYRLMVPRDARLQKIETVNGSISIKDVRAGVDLRTVNGAIRASGLESDARLKTVNGAIEATFDAVSANQRITAESVNGACDLRLPKTAGAQVRLSSLNGGIKCGFPIVAETSAHGSLRGVIGDGATLVTAKTVNGGIVLRQD